MSQKSHLFKKKMQTVTYSPIYTRIAKHRINMIMQLSYSLHNSKDFVTSHNLKPKFLHICIKNIVFKTDWCAIYWNFVELSAVQLK